MQGLLVSILSLAALSQSAPLTEAQKSCQEYTLTVNTTSLNYGWAWGELNNNEDVAAFLTAMGRRDAKTTFQPATPPTTPETAVYTISGTFCQPNGGGDGTVLVATHGGGFDRLYWHPTIQPEKYSFVDHAVAQGYSIFYYDRVGLGQSDSLSGYVAQSSIHSAALTEIVKVVRSDRFGAPASKVVLVGHSMGNGYSNLVLHSNPELVDAAILTGAAYGPGGGGNPQRWGELDGGWTTWVDVYSGIQGFFTAPYYDPEVVKWVEENKQPSSVLERYSLRLSNFSSPDFTGPVMIMSGEFDTLVCEGNCVGILADKTTEVFPASKDLVAYVHPNCGHGINFALNATGAFEVMTDFLKKNDI